MEAFVFTHLDVDVVTGNCLFKVRSCDPPDAQKLAQERVARLRERINPRPLVLRTIYDMCHPPDYQKLARERLTRPLVLRTIYDMCDDYQKLARERLARIRERSRTRPLLNTIYDLWDPQLRPHDPS